MNELTKIGLNYIVDAGKLDPKEKEKIAKDYDLLDYEGDDKEYFDIAAVDEDNYDIPYDAIVEEYWDDEETIEESLEDYIKKGDKYLVYAYGVRWNGADGYKIAKSRVDAITRDYEVTISVDSEYTGKATKCRESSHDVPMGSTTYIIPISNAEAEEIEDMSFSEVQSFVEKKI